MPIRESGSRPMYTPTPKPVLLGDHLGDRHVDDLAMPRFVGAVDRVQRGEGNQLVPAVHVVHRIRIDGHWWKRVGLLVRWPLVEAGWPPRAGCRGPRRRPSRRP